ncbi:MAG: L,D-transpeptidase family protein [Pseudomonadota bacterium]
MMKRDLKTTLPVTKGKVYDSGSTTLSADGKTRRHFLSALAAAPLLPAVPALASAETAIDRILNSSGRDSWDDQFSGSKVMPEKGRQGLAVFAPETQTFVAQAIRDYEAIVGGGGWPVVPANKKLEMGDTSPAVVALRRRLMISGDLPTKAGLSPKFDSFVDTAVRSFQVRHGLPQDGVMGRFSFAALNVSAPIRLGQLRTNLVRLRSMAGFLGERYVMVNIPAAEIEAVEGNRIAQRHTAIVGRISRQTPILNSKIYELNLNPYWTAPKSIIQKDLIPLMRKDPNYLTDNKILIFDDNKQEIDPKSIDWSSEEAVNYRFRQEPGKINAMGAAKINFPNPHAVYLHDTPQQNLFSKSLRFDSSGCVRVKNVRDLLVWLAKDTPGIDRRIIEQIIESRERTDLKLIAPVPIYMTYISAWSAGPGDVHFRDDIYQRDGVDELALNQ